MLMQERLDFKAYPTLPIGLLRVLLNPEIEDDTANDESKREQLAHVDHRRNGDSCLLVLGKLNQEAEKETHDKSERKNTPLLPCGEFFLLHPP